MQVNNVRELPTFNVGEKVRLTYSEQNQTIRGILLDCMGREIEIQPENMPREFRKIKSPIHFNALLRNAYARIQEMTDGKFSLHVLQQGKDGEGDRAYAETQEPDLVSKMIPIISKGLEDLSKKEVKENGILFVGRTGAGKSFLANVLSGRTAKTIIENGRAKFDCDTPYFPVGHSLKSCTGCPNVHSPNKEDFTYIDFPGFDDTDATTDITSGFFRKEILNNVKNMKTVLVIDYQDIVNKGNYLSETLNSLIQFLGFSHLQDPGKMRRLVDSISLVVTKVPVTNGQKNAVTKDHIARDIRDYANGVNRNLSKIGQSVLGRILDQGKWEIFSEPSDISSRLDEEKKNIMELVENKSHYFNKAEANIKAEVSDKYLGKVQFAITSLIVELKREFPSKIIQLMSNILENNYANFKNEGEIRNYQKQFQAFIESKTRQGLSAFVQSMGLGGGILEEARYLDVSLKFLIDLLPPSNEKPNYPRDWIQELEMKPSLQVLNQYLLRMVEPAKLTVSDNKMILVGYFPKVSQITSVLKNYASITEIEIHAHHSVIVDENLEGKKMKGVNVTVIAPHWDIRGQRKIDITGKDCDLTHPSLNTKAAAPDKSDGTDGAHGANGAPGLPGKNGGHFFGFGNSFSGIDRLTIISKGGKGGTGQDSAPGQSGADGPDGAANLIFPLSMEAAVVKERVDSVTGWDSKEFPPRSHGNGTYDMDLKNYGKAGGKGGNGGQAGAGGLGGLKGIIEFYSLGDDQTCHIENRDGRVGTNGEAAEGGIGGRKGREWSGVWHLEESKLNKIPAVDIPLPPLPPALKPLGPILPDLLFLISPIPPIFNRRIRELPLQFPLGLPIPVQIDHPLKSVSKWNDAAECQPKHKEFGPRSLSGTKSIEINSVGREAPAPLEVFDINERLYRYRRFTVLESNPLVAGVFEKFRREYDNHRRVKEKTSVDNFFKECKEMEDLYMQIDDKSKCIPLYEAMLERIHAFMPPEGNTRDIALLQLLYTHTLSKLCQLNAMKDSHLIIDIKGYLKRVNSNIEDLNRLDHRVNVKVVEGDYLDQIQSQINESDIFIKKLQQDIKLADKEIDIEINALVKEIEEMQANNAAKKSEIAAKRAELKALIAKKQLLGAITIAVQCIGCCTGPYGAIAASIISIGLTVWSNSETAPEIGAGLLMTYAEGIAKITAEGSNVKLIDVNQLALSRVRAYTLAQAAMNVLPNESAEAQLKAMGKMIKKIDEEQILLDQFKNKVKGDFKESMHQIVDQAADIQNALQNQSKIALEFSRLAVKRAFKNIIGQIKQVTQIFTTGKRIVNIMEQLEEAIETSAKIYEHVQDYEERRRLVRYMAKLAATDVSDSRKDAYQQKVQRNLVLDQYHHAVSAVRQWAFPFASHFIGDFIELDSFATQRSDDDFMSHIKGNLKRLKDRVEIYHTEINGLIDNFLWTENFSSSNPQLGPFYVWKGSEHKQEISELLMGKPVFLYADVNRTSPAISAVKFSRIELEFKCDDLLVQAELDQAMAGVRIELKHSGLSHYKFQGEIYQMANDRGFSFRYRHEAGGGQIINQNNVRQRGENGESMLSPYSQWMFKLDLTPEFYKKFGKHLSQIEIHLAGRGKYIEEERVKNNQWDLIHYQDNVVIGGARRTV